ncbi:MAG: radical SAM protein [Planctomycetes bacterium]|nr:radical SAM protein [Planctomycetota bacterium]
MKIRLLSISPLSPYRFHRKYLGLGYLHAYALADHSLRQRIEIEHTCFDITGAIPETMAGKILETSCDLIGFSCFVWNTPFILKTSYHLKRLNPCVKIILGGPEVESAPRRLLEENACIDFICTGPGEKTFRELLHALLDNKPKGNVHGLAYREGDVLKFNPPHLEKQDLDEFPSPYLTGAIEVDDEDRGAFFQTSRGCPYRCGYCAWSRDHAYAEFSLERVIAEMEYFKKAGAEALFSVDATFNLNAKRVIRILEAMSDLKMETGLWFEAHPKLLTEPFVKALAKLPGTFMGLGIQTTNPEAMKHIDRVWDPVRTGELLDHLARYENCHRGYEIIVGLPGDNLETFKETFSWVYRRKPSWIFTFALEVFPGTPLAGKKDALQIMDAGPDQFYEIVSNYSFSAEEIQVGKAMGVWNSVMMQVFYRLTLATGIPAGDLLEQWSWHAYHAGLYDKLPGYVFHNVKWNYVESVAEAFHAFCSKLFFDAGLPDISLQLKEMLRYTNARRCATEEAAFFIRALDIQGITVDPRFNRILKKEALAGKLGQDKGVERTFAFDMQALWPLTEIDRIAALPLDEHTYRFVTDEKGLAVAIENQYQEGPDHLPY